MERFDWIVDTIRYDSIQIIREKMSKFLKKFFHLKFSLATTSIGKEKIFFRNFEIFSRFNCIELYWIVSYYDSIDWIVSYYNSIEPIHLNRILLQFEKKFQSNCGHDSIQNFRLYCGHNFNFFICDLKCCLYLSKNKFPW